MTDSGITVSTVDTLVLPEPIREQLMVHLLQCAPNEGVGMLGVYPPEGGPRGQQVTAAQFVPGRNIDESPNTFTMDPNDVFRAFRQFREQGLVLGAIVHSHLRGPVTPSETDVLRWNYPEALMLIASFAQQPPALAAWRVVEQGNLAVVQGVSLRVIEAQKPASGEI